MFDKDELKILECTLRDGSYVVDFGFTANDTLLISAALQDVGFDLIETGHGIGLGATEKGMGVAAATDEAYMKATSEAVDKAKWGMFGIPGIATLDHVKMGADYGMDFIRIGTNIDEIDQGRPFVDEAKKHGMSVCCNFMKSYAKSPAFFAKLAKQAEDFGADAVYLVDSAGGMLGEHIAEYIDAAMAEISIPLGYHGHNNLGLANANALVACDKGATIIDTSLQGFGRSSGNVITEQFICALQRKGIDLGIDPIAVMDIGEKYICPLIPPGGLSTLDMVSGLAQFHSSYIGVIREFSSKYGVDPRRLIMAVCKENIMDAPRDLVEAKAKDLAEQGLTTEATTSRFHFERYHGNEQEKPS